MKNAVRLNLQFNLPDSKTRILSSHGINKKIQYPLFVKKYVTKKNIEHIKKILPAEIIEKIVGIHISDIVFLDIHSHKFDSSVINFYIKTNREKTVFYKKISQVNFENIINHDNNEWLDNNDVYNKILEDKVVEEENFIAEDGECWLLNTKTPHAVKSDNTNNNRTLLQIYLKTSYQESLSILNEICIQE
jgi:hypothetical protein